MFHMTGADRVTCYNECKAWKENAVDQEAYVRLQPFTTLPKSCRTGAHVQNQQYLLILFV